MSDQKPKKVLVIGGGITGITAALELSKNDIPVDVVDTSPFLGGHAAQLACKATDTCVKCGACIIEEKLERLANTSNIQLFLNSQIKNISNNDGYLLSITRGPSYIDPEKCTDCGKCFKNCPESGAIIQGFSKNNHPFFAIDMKSCVNSKKQSCHICVDVCPESAIDLKKRKTTVKTSYNAVIAATGFQTANPKEKPYGYGHFENVITNLDMERMLKTKNYVFRPSDKKPPQKIGFVQCVGSRDSMLNHLWCSRYCCGSALRLANVIKSRSPETDITVFYIDIQTVGTDFEKFYSVIKQDIHFIRSIPGDVFHTKDNKLRVTYYNACDQTQTDEVFDLLVLSIGMTPCDDNRELIESMGIQPADFSDPKDKIQKKKDIFTAGAMTHPMTILESIASGEMAAIKVLKYIIDNE